MVQYFLYKKQYQIALAVLFYLTILGLSQSMAAQETIVPPYSEDYQVVTNDGAWCWFSDPRAIYVGDKIFGGFVDKQGSIWAFRYFFSRHMVEQRTRRCTIE